MGRGQNLGGRYSKGGQNAFGVQEKGAEFRGGAVGKGEQNFFGAQMHHVNIFVGHKGGGANTICR